jgi:hypothetical protein
MIPYSGELDDLESLDPNILFSSNGFDQNFDEQNATFEERILIKSRAGISHMQSKLKSEKEINIEGQYEMKYNYIFMKEIEGNDKMSVSKALMNCQDIKLFE